MKHNAKFLNALLEFISGEEKKSAQVFKDFLEDNPPPQEDMLWALNVLRNAASEGSVETLRNIDFVGEIIRLADKLEQPTQHHNSISTESPSGYRSDQGMNVQKRMQLGMGYGGDNTYEKSASRVLHSALSKQGWKAITSFLAELNQRKDSPLKTVREIARKHHLTNDICHFQMGTNNYTMIGPSLQQAISKHIVSETLYPIQKGEREQSLLSRGSTSRFSSLVSLVQEKLVEKKIDPEIAIVKRNSRRHGTKPICYTALFQDVLREHDIIRQIPDSPRRAVSIQISKIPSGGRELENLADRISDSIIQRQDERVVPPPEEAVIYRYLAIEPSKKVLSRQ